MKISMTENAIQRISEKMNGKNGYLKIKYDIEGCGCVVSGVPVLWFVDVLDEDDIPVKTNAQTIYIEKSKAVFLDENMSINFSEEANSFQLKSPNQILNGRMSLVDKTAT